MALITMQANSGMYQSDTILVSALLHALSRKTDPELRDYISDRVYGGYDHAKDYIEYDRVMLIMVIADMGGGYDAL